MSDRKQALQDLRDKVAAGAGIEYAAYRKAFDGIDGRPAEMDYPILRDQARLSFMGSLDAAKALHDAVLPEWDVTHAWGNSSGWEWNLKRKWDGVPMYSNAHDKDPARAWLLAILSALIAKDETP